MGGNKHRAYLNYWYGVVVEEALQQGAEDDVRKREKARCYPDHEEMVEEAFIHLYGKTRAELLKDYRKRPASPILLPSPWPTAKNSPTGCPSCASTSGTRPGWPATPARVSAT